MIEIRVYATTVASTIPMVVYWGALVVFVIGVLILLRWKGLKTGVRYVSVLLLGEWVALMLCATVIFRTASAERGFRLIPFSSYWDFGPHSYLMEMIGQNILNVVLFVPVGFLLGCGFIDMTWKRAVLVGSGLSVSIELLQLLSHKGFCEVDDVLHNSLGCLIGYGAYATKIFISKFVG
jgi:glycopeptide antibiotics resistance protein